MNKFITLIAASTMIAGLSLSSAMALQAAPQSAEKAKEMMKMNDDKGNSAEAKMKAEQMKMEAKAKADTAKMKEKPPSK